ncbi:hypothetical protein [Pseudomarimonas arenosa]|uniref:Phytase-like domain-containing protein n=1 Tax=Pseudomarimonas arenosa TaxID=2774145 RepID=A0AAW3ZLE0_9GAMM|nr:hypothetical protein [Pseudomarimonas arenosa]MBD8526861.1 hypothetical protein [Pseudomarimonas arenosa]
MKPCVYGRLLGLTVTACLGGPAMAKLPPGISGPWYNPAQSGHGLSVDLVAPDRAVVLWHTYDNQGGPMTLYIEGSVNGRRIEGTAYAPRGMRFGSFSAADLQLPVWGQVTLEFPSCNSAQLSWDAASNEFDDGSMTLAKLAFLDGVECRLPPENALPVTLASGTSDTQGGHRPSFSLHGLIDQEGRLWAIERGLPIPGPTWVGAYTPEIAVIEPVSTSEAQAVQVSGAVFDAMWATNLYSVRDRYQGEWRRDSDGVFQLIAPPTQSFGRWNYNRFRATPPTGYSLVAPVALADLAEGFEVITRGQFFPFLGALSVTADGRVCVRISGATSNGCDFAGKISAGEGELGLLDVELTNQNDPLLSPYRGRGWLMEGPQGRELILVGHNGVTGLGLIGTAL